MTARPWRTQLRWRDTPARKWQVWTPRLLSSRTQFACRIALRHCDTSLIASITCLCQILVYLRAPQRLQERGGRVAIRTKAPRPHARTPTRPIANQAAVAHDLPKCVLERQSELTIHLALYLYKRSEAPRFLPLHKKKRQNGVQQEEGWQRQRL